jgi:hypothetical protein
MRRGTERVENEPQPAHGGGPIAAAKRAQALALRAQADALEAEADALEGAPSADQLLTKDTWPADLVVTFRAVRDAARRGELRMHKAGRSPAVKRSDVLRWLEGRPVSVSAVAEETTSPRSKEARRARARAEFQEAAR